MLDKSCCSFDSCPVSWDFSENRITVLHEAQGGEWRFSQIVSCLISKSNNFVVEVGRPERNLRAARRKAAKQVSW